MGERAKAIFKCIVTQGYGMTETSPTINTNPFERIKLESCGPPFPDTIEKVVSLDTGEELPAGVTPAGTTGEQDLAPGKQI